MSSRNYRRRKMNADKIVCNSRPTCVCVFCVRRNQTESPRDEQRRLANEFVALLKSRMG
jgi:hypothetical protein